MQYIIFIIVTLYLSNCLAFSKTEDELYKEIVKQEDKDVQSSSQLSSSVDTIIEMKKKQLSHIESVQEFNEEVNISPARYPIASSSLSWEEIVESVSSGYPSAFVVNELRILTDKNNPEATELLAWMCATGVGVKKNLQASWFLYMKADSLDVVKAKENAEKIYNTMSKKEKRKLLRY